ncbi:unnamed protein product, partial [Linum tenue]
MVPGGEVVPVPFLLVVVSVSGFRGGRNRGSRFPCGKDRSGGGGWVGRVLGFLFFYFLMNVIMR